MSDDKALEQGAESQDKGDVQDAVLNDISSETVPEEALEILEASGIEGSLFLSPEQAPAASQKASRQSKSVKEEVQGDDGNLGVRFNSMEEAEAETRKLQSERDKLQAKLEKVEKGIDPEIKDAMQLVKDIQNDPKLAEGLTEYFRTGQFPGSGPVDNPSGDADSYDSAYDSYGSASPEDIEKEVQKRVSEQLRSKEIENRKLAYFDAQKQALLEAYPEVDEEAWSELVEFAEDPTKMTLVNLYRLKNLNREVEDRAKVLAERYLRSGGRQIRPSASSAAGSGREAEEEDPQYRIVKDIVDIGRKDSLY